MRQNPITIIKTTFVHDPYKDKVGQEIAASQHRARFVGIAVKALQVFGLGRYGGTVKYHVTDAALCM